MKTERILINRLHLAEQQFMRDFKPQKEIYDEIVKYLAEVNIEITEKDIPNKLAFAYTESLKDLVDIPVNSKLKMLERKGKYDHVLGLIDQLTFDYKTFSDPQKYIEENVYQYAETEEEISTVRWITRMANQLRSHSIPKSSIIDLFRRYSMNWNPYDQKEITFTKSGLNEGIDSEISIKAHNKRSTVKI